MNILLYKISRNAPLATGRIPLPAYHFVILKSLVLVMYSRIVWLILCLYMYAKIVNKVDVMMGRSYFRGNSVKSSIEKKKNSRFGLLGSRYSLCASHGPDGSWHHKNGFMKLVDVLKDSITYAKVDLMLHEGKLEYVKKK